MVSKTISLYTCEFRQAFSIVEVKKPRIILVNSLRICIQEVWKCSSLNIQLFIICTLTLPYTKPVQFQIYTHSRKLLKCVWTSGTKLLNTQKGATRFYIVGFVEWSYISACLYRNIITIKTCAFSVWDISIMNQYCKKC